MVSGALLILANEKNEVLLQHKDASAPTYPNKWCLFGGGIEKGETPQRAIHREFLEELEWEPHEIKHFATYKGNDVFVAQSNKPAWALREKLHEGDDLGYFSESQIMSMDVAAPHLEAIRDYYTKNSTIIVHFICRGNALRSVIAEAYLNSLNIAGVRAVSSGTFANENKSQNLQRQQETRQLLKQNGLLQYAKRDFAEQLTPQRLQMGSLTICVNKAVLDGFELANSLPDDTIFWDIADIGEKGRIATSPQELRTFETAILHEIIHEVDRLVQTHLTA